MWGEKGKKEREKRRKEENGKGKRQKKGQKEQEKKDGAKRIFSFIVLLLVQKLTYP